MAAPFTTVTTEGGLLPADFLARVANLDKDLPAIDADGYRLAEGSRIADAIQEAWTRLRASHASFRAALQHAAEGDPATGLTREKWLLPLFDALGFGRLAPAQPIETGDRTFAISHGWGPVPIHLIGAGVPLDRRTAGVAGAARASPHSLVQEALNRSDRHLWGIVSNGRELRLLRDSASLTRQSYVSFDLDGLFGGEVFSDFRLLWLLLHVSRFDAPRPEEAPIEHWSETARRQGTRALDRLREGVTKAIEALGAGFLAHPRNSTLRDRLRSGGLGTLDYYRQLLRLVYRLLFLLVAEERDLLLPRAASREARDRYRNWYSVARLKRLAARRGGSQHHDLYEQLKLLFGWLGRDEGCPPLALPALGGLLWSGRAAPDLDASMLRNRDLLETIRRLAWIEENRLRRAVDYKNLGPEELGGVYESLLELHPEVDAGGGRFALAAASGHERKTTGSYYTPESLVQCLLDSALDPLLDEAARTPDPEAAILDLKVCDPACGSGHFLIAAAHRIARRLAAARTGEEAPSPEAVRAALRDVIGHCLYGVDLNEMAVELCKVNLWLEALEPGRPLSFLDSRILHGNSLLGATPELLERGVPVEAFALLAGDDPEVLRAIRRTHRDELKRQLPLFGTVGESIPPETGIVEAARQLAALPDDTIQAIRHLEAGYRGLRDSPGYRRSHLVADAFCAAFVWPKQPDSPAPPTHALFNSLRAGAAAPAATAGEIARLAAEYRFFHWHLAFPDVFARGGFDVVLGNPPWERVKLQEQEWFAARSPEIAKAPNAAERKRRITELKQTDPGLFAAFEADLRRSEGESHLIRESGRFQLCGRGDVNTYSVFAELMRTLLSPRGRLGCIVPTGIATDDTTKHFFGDLVGSGALRSLYDFENAVGMFEGVGHGRFKFCLLTSARSGDPLQPAEFAFFLHHVTDLRDPERRFTLDAEEMALLNPNTRTCPVFRTRRDAEVTKAIYRRVPVLVKEGTPEENPWGVSFARMFDMSNDSGLFRTHRDLEEDGFALEGSVFWRGKERYLPLYEAKMLHHFDHRYGDYRDQPEGSENTSLPEVPLARLKSPAYTPLPRYWVPAPEVDSRLAERWSRQWLLGFRDITNATNERTVIASVLPRVGIGNKLPLILTSGVSPRHAAALCANLDAIALDFVARQKMGGATMNFFIFKQLPVLSPAAYDRSTGSPLSSSLLTWIVDRALELLYVSWDLAPFARDCGFDGPPFPYDPERRFQLRCELDAAFFHLYGISKDDAAYILDTFPIVRRNDEARYGSYRTKATILELYDQLPR